MSYKAIQELFYKACRVNPALRILLLGTMAIIAPVFLAVLWFGNIAAYITLELLDLAVQYLQELDSFYEWLPEGLRGKSERYGKYDVRTIE